MSLDKERNFLNLISNKNWYFGILSGITILLKQTSGIVFSIIFIFYKIIYVISKEEFKEYIKIVLIRLLGVIIPVLIFLVYLLQNGILLDFLDYAIIGIDTFSNKLGYMTLISDENMFVRVLAIIIPLKIILMTIMCVIWTVTKKVKENEWIKNLTILLFYTLASAVVIFPISDRNHFIVGTMCRNVSNCILLIYIFQVSNV